MAMMDPERTSGDDGVEWAGLDVRLGALPSHDLDAARAAHLRREARASFVAAHRRHQAPRPSPWRRTYRQVLEPAWVTLFCLAYLAWALGQAAALLG